MAKFVDWNRSNLTETHLVERVTFANINHGTCVEVTWGSIGEDAAYRIIGNDLLVTDGELIALCVLSPLDGYGWYEV